ncbi:ead/Ea22-like family protein [Salmonella enterica subsp. enterica serovar Curacao]|nr:ead/Ea22-like family protein [Salmonella enterica subsp. enterica serovar Curacao]EDR5661785.1 ead/Ea22-like family protein [Salmonella enterica]
MDKQALLVSKAKASVFTMEYISQFEASDIDSDDVDLRFEVDGVETGTTVSIVDECGHAAQIITALLDELEAARQRIAELEDAQCQHESDTLMLCHQFDELASAMGWTSELAMKQGVGQLEYARSIKTRIAELEAKLETADKLQDSAFRDGLKAGFSYGQTDDQSGFAQCMSAYSTRTDIGVKVE